MAKESSDSGVELEQATEPVATANSPALRRHVWRRAEESIALTRQIQSVEAGDALRILEKESRLATIGLGEVKRQQNKDYKAAIKSLRADPAVGFDKLDRMGAIKEASTGFGRQKPERGQRPGKKRERDTIPKRCLGTSCEDSQRALNFSIFASMRAKSLYTINPAHYGRKSLTAVTDTQDSICLTRCGTHGRSRFVIGSARSANHYGR